jgi:hypothetical protein
MVDKVAIASSPRSLTRIPDGHNISRLWGFTPARLSQIAADPNRPASFDFALWGNSCWP